MSFLKLTPPPFPLVLLESHNFDYVHYIHVFVFFQGFRHPSAVAMDIGVDAVGKVAVCDAATSQPQ